MENKNYRNAISVKNLLVVTLRYLATEDSLKSLKYLFIIQFSNIKKLDKITQFINLITSCKSRVQMSQSTKVEHSVFPSTKHKQTCFLLMYQFEMRKSFVLCYVRLVETRHKI